MSSQRATAPGFIYIFLEMFISFFEGQSPLSSVGLRLVVSAGLRLAVSSGL